MPSISQPLITDNHNLTPTTANYWKTAIRFTRRYSIVVSEVTLLALNILFLIGKEDERLPKEFSATLLTALSTFGVLSLPYSMDTIWKALQDTRFSFLAKSPLVCIAAGCKTLQSAVNVALTIGNFAAAIEGQMGLTHTQLKLYEEMIPWGEGSLATGLAITIIWLLMSQYAHRSLGRHLEAEEADAIAATLMETAHEPHPSAASIRFCMDKDTLWEMVNQLKENPSKAAEILTIAKDNLQTQVRVTFGGRLLLVIGGDILMAIEKAYTPNSLVSAAINCGVSVVYAIKICIEKGLEIAQRRKMTSVEIPNLIE